MNFSKLPPVIVEPRMRHAEMTAIEREMVRKIKLHAARISRFIVFRANDARMVTGAEAFDKARAEAEIEAAEERVAVVIIDRDIVTDTDAGIVWRAL